MQTLLLYALCSASLFYLGSRAIITSWLWSSYSPRFAGFMDCPACTGTWYMTALSAIGGFWLHLPFMGLPGDHITTVIAAALAGMCVTPIVTGLMQRGFDMTGGAVPPEDHEPGPG